MNKKGGINREIQKQSKGFRKSIRWYGYFYTGKTIRTINGLFKVTDEGNEFKVNIAIPIKTGDNKITGFYTEYDIIMTAYAKWVVLENIRWYILFKRYKLKFYDGISSSKIK